MSDEPGTLVVRETGDNGEPIETRRRLSTLMKKDTVRAFSEVSKALGLNLAHLHVENPLEKKMLAQNFNAWLQDKSKKGVLVIQDKNLSEIPYFVPGLHYDCIGIDMQFNDIKQVTNINGLTHLKTLDMSHNLLSSTDCLTEEILELPHLQELCLGDNQFEEIPTLIPKLKELRRLDLQDNYINYIPEEICDLEKLVILDLRYNEIPYLPNRINDLYNLTTLLMDGNILLQPLPDTFYELCNLKNLSLRGTALESFPERLCEMKQLTTLNLSHNSIPMLPDGIGNLVRLKKLDISYNQISQLPETFAWLISLNEFEYVGNTKILDIVPQKIRKNVHSIRLFYRNVIRKDLELRALMFDELECENNIRKKKPSRRNDEEQNLVQGGTIEKLVQLLTHESFSSLNYSRCFLLLYQSFCSSEELLNLLILRYKSSFKECESKDEAKQKIVRVRVLNTMTKWIESHPQHFYKDLVRQIGVFVESIPDKEGRKLRKAQQRLIDGSAGVSIIVQKKIPTPKPILPSVSSFPITSVDPKELARQVSLMEHEFLSKIQPEEFLNQNWTGRDKAEKAPNLTRHIQYFNRFSAVVSSSVLKYKDTKQRVQAISLFLLVAEEARLLNNFNTVIEIVAALQSTPIHRLKITWKLVSNKLKIIWENLQALTSIEGNAKNYRKALLEAASQPRVPNIGIILKDLTFLHDGNPDVLSDNPELINFGKLRHLEEIIEQIQHYQRTPYNFEAVKPIQNVIMTTEVWDDIQAYNESLICEDREGKTPAMRGEIVAEQNDTIINLDLNLTPEQLELAEKSRHEWKDTQLQLGLATGNEVTKSGHLMIRENQSWNKMWFTMQFPSLYYYEKQTEKRPSGVIKLIGANVEKIGKKKNFAIVISHPTSRPYALRGDSDKETLSWYTDLCNLLNK